MAIEATDLVPDTSSKAAVPKRIEPAKHGGAQSRKFAEVSSALTLTVGMPVAFNSALDAFVVWDPNTGIDAAVNEVQELNIAAGADGGTFALHFKGQVSGTIAFDATAATIETAFEALSNVGAGNGTVAGSVGGPFTITFTGSLAGAPQDLVVVDTALLLDGAIQSDADISRLTAGSAGGVTNAVQTMSDAGTATGGTFTLTFDGQTTAAIDYDETAANIETAIDLLSNVATGAISVSGGTLPGTPIVFTFDGASVAGVDVPLISADSTLLTGTTPDYTVVETTAGSFGAGAPAGTIVGFVYPEDIVLSTTGEKFGIIMMKGAIHADDVPLPTVGTPIQADLDAAMRDGLLARGLLVTGLSSVR